MSRKKKPVTADISETITQEIDTLELLREFRDKKQKSAEITDDARDKFAVAAIDEFLASIDDAISRKDTA